MTKQQKVTQFFNRTTSTDGFSEKQWRMFDKETDRWAKYREEYKGTDAEVSRDEYFEYEVATWSDEKLDEFIESFNL